MFCVFLGLVLARILIWVMFFLCFLFLGFFFFVVSVDDLCCFRVLFLLIAPVLQGLFLLLGFLFLLIVPVYFRMSVSSDSLCYLGFCSSIS